MGKSATTFLKILNKSEPLFVDILIKRAEENPDKKAFTFLENGTSQILTYQELDKKIRRLAAFLQQKNLKGERALLLYPPGFDYMVGYFACLYAGIIAVPVYPPDPTKMEKTLPRLESVAKDAHAKIALSTKLIIDQVAEWKRTITDGEIKVIENENKDVFLEKLKDVLDIDWLATDVYSEKTEDLWIYPDISSEDISYLQYTSGSTGTPKGVMITHNNLLHNTHLIYNGFDLGGCDHEGVIWLPIYHDMGLVGGILEPILAGFHCNLLSPIDFLKRPLRWLQIISDKNDMQIVSGGPNFAYDLCLRATTESKRKELDLSNWRVAFTGAEPVRAETINEFSKAFKVSGFSEKAFYPCYGLAEGTLIVSGSNINKAPFELSVDKEKLKSNVVAEQEDVNNSSRLVSSGSSLLDGIIRIVNPDTKQLCPDRIVGEIWSLSKSNAKGYWEKRELSNETFNAFTTDSNEGPFLRTGDLGFMTEGELFITGRLKDLIIIRGSNHYPQDIELSVEKSNKLLRPGSVAAFSVDVDNEENLVIVQEARAKQNVDWEIVCEDIKKAVLIEHNIIPHKIVLIKPKTIFKTSSGKIQRKTTRYAYLNNTLDIIYQWECGSIEDSESSVTTTYENESEDHSLQKNLDENYISQFISKRLATELKINLKNIDKDLPFTDYGLDSAKSILLVGELENIVGKTLEPTILWNYPTINKLAMYLASGDIKNVDSDNKNKNEKEGEFLEIVDNLSEEEAADLLLKKLGIDK